jgi:hypothetical protein
MSCVVRESFLGLRRMAGVTRKNLTKLGGASSSKLQWSNTVFGGSVSCKMRTST